MGLVFLNFYTSVKFVAWEEKTPQGDHSWNHFMLSQNTLLNATESGEQWGAIKGAQMAGWPGQFYCCTNGPKGVDVVLFSFILPVCLPFSTQTKCSFVAVFGHRTGSAVLPQWIPHSSLQLPHRYSHLCEQAGGNLQYVHGINCREQGGICMKGSLVVKVIPMNLFTHEHPFLIVSVWMQPMENQGRQIS